MLRIIIVLLSLLSTQCYAEFLSGATPSQLFGLEVLSSG